MARTKKKGDKGGGKIQEGSKPCCTSTVNDQLVHASTIQFNRDVLTGRFAVKQHAYLEVLCPDQRSEIFELGEGEAIIGRSKQCDIQLPFEDVSRRHARVMFRNEEYHLEDLDSTNGVHVNSVKVVKCVLRNNDQIEIGGVKILFSEEKIILKQ